MYLFVFQNMVELYKPCLIPVKYCCPSILPREEEKTVITAVNSYREISVVRYSGRALLQDWDRLGTLYTSSAVLARA